MSGAQPDLVVEIAFTTDPLSTTPSWTDVSQYVRHTFGATSARGRPTELDEFQPGSVTLTLSNTDRRFDPRHSAGPHFGNLKPGKAIRVRQLGSAVYYPLFFGFIESWPQEYDDGDVDATVTIEAFDGLTILSEFVQPDPVFKYTLSTIGSCQLFLRNSDGNTWFDESGFGRHAYRQVDPAHATTSFGSTIFRSRPKPHTTNTYIGGQGYELPGAGASSAPAGVNGAATISSSMAVGLTSPSVTGGLFKTASTISLGANWSVSLWLMCDLASVFGQPIPTINVVNDVSTAMFQISSIGIIGAGDTGAGIFVQALPNPVDGKPHHWVVSTAGATMSVYLDGVLQATFGSAAAATFLSIDLDTWEISNTSPYPTALKSPPVSNVVVQDITLFSKAISAAEALGLYQRGAGLLPETSSARVSRLIADTDWPSAWVNTTSNPKATCVDYTTAFQGTMDALSEVAATEQGRIFVDASGVLQFLGRYYQFEVTAGKTSQATFSDDGTGVPYKQIATDYSSREVQNDITVIATLGVSANATDSASITAYRRQPNTISTLLPGATEAADMAAGLLLHRKDAVTRLSQPVTIQPAAKTTNWPTILGLEIGHRVTLKLTPMRTVGSQIVQQMVIEGISWDITVDDYHVSYDLAPIPGDAVAANTWAIADDATFGLAGTARAGY